MLDQAKTRPTRPRRLKGVTRWDIETDVAIVGFGGAGACAAIEAHDAGAEVVVFEAASGGGGSTALSSAEIYMGGNGGTRVQKACGYEDRTEDMVTYVTMLAGPQADEAKIRGYCEGSVGHFEWLVDKGIPFKDSELKERAIMALTDDCLLYTGSEQAWPFVKSARPCPRGHNLQIKGDRGGPLFTRIMVQNVHERGIRIECEARALTLIADQDDSVHGLVVRINGEEKTVRARKGVILCAGGFVMNPAMMRRYAPDLADNITPIGNSEDLGSGILMGLGVGAAAINMHECFVTLPFYPPSSLTFGIFVNDMAQRFINEDCYHGRVAAFARRQLGSRIYLVANVEDHGDKVSYLGAPVAGTGETIEELEEELAFAPGSLSHTVQYYNDHAARGEDPLFHKSAEWLKAIEPPYVALDCTPGRGAIYPCFTLGGLDTGVSGEALTAEGEVIPGLYAAGRTACGIVRRGDGYSSGMSVGDATFSGRMAGKAAASRQL
jgi:succinate dehydrogenase/fumarate reductase flavoprotein subunit